MNPDDPRLGELTKPGLDGDVVVLGFPFDAGETLSLFAWFMLRVI